MLLMRCSPATLHVIVSEGLGIWWLPVPAVLQGAVVLVSRLVSVAALKLVQVLALLSTIVNNDDSNALLDIPL